MSHLISPPPQSKKVHKLVLLSSLIYLLVTSSRDINDKTNDTATETPEIRIFGRFPKLYFEI